MRILETRDGKVIAEIDGKYLTRVVFSNNSNFLAAQKTSIGEWPIGQIANQKKELENGKQRVG